MATQKSSTYTENTAFLAGGGELGHLIRRKNWSATPLGSPTNWSASVRTTVSLCLTSRFPIILWLGSELRILYNDAYAPLLGERKHPVMLGAPEQQAWGEIWDTIGPLLEEANTGGATWHEDLQFFLARHLPEEEAYVTLSYSPIVDVNERAVEGVFCACTETTGRVIGQRRLATLRDLGTRHLYQHKTSNAYQHKSSNAYQHTTSNACQQAIKALEANPLDIAFAAIYLVENDRASATRIARTRLPVGGEQALPISHGLSDNDGPWPFAAGTSVLAVQSRLPI